MLILVWVKYLFVYIVATVIFVPDVSRMIVSRSYHHEDMLYVPLIFSCHKQTLNWVYSGNVLKTHFKLGVNHVSQLVRRRILKGTKHVGKLDVLDCGMKKYL